MQWIELSVRVDAAGVKEVAAFLQPYGQGGAIVEQWDSDPEGAAGGAEYNLVKIYLPHSRSYRNIRLEIFRGLTGLKLQDHLGERLLKAQDWLDSLKQHFGIVEIGERFIIKPSWLLNPSPESTRIVVELDPGAAFGTGLHATTRLCLLRLEKHCLPGMHVLDLGTGSGILAIAAARLGAAAVLALDIDAMAVKAATSNVRANQVDKMVEVKRGSLSRMRVKQYRNCFNLALANITAGSICALARELFQVLKPGGRLVVSGIVARGLDEVLISLAMADFKIEAADQEGEWYAITAAKE